MRRSSQLSLTACVTVVVLALAGCGGGSDSDGAAPLPVRLYGTDGNMQDSFARALADPTMLAGMKGTAPATPLPAQFTNRVLEIDPTVADFTFTGETYDAVVIVALAAELAGTPDPEQVRHYIKSVTAGGERCDSVSTCLELARQGSDLAYRGVSLRRGGLTDAGEPAAASYATLHFGGDGQIDRGKTEFVGAGDEAATTAAPAPTPGARPDPPEQEIEPLKLGGLLPETGALSFAYAQMRVGAVLAVTEINEAGGVFGLDVVWVDGDDGTNPEVAAQTVASHVQEGVHAIIGAGASGVSAAVLPDVVAAKRILFSPSNTAAHLPELPHEGYYFRTAPSDRLQGAALADIILRDGVEKVVIVAREDAYGEGLRDDTVSALRRFGVPSDEILALGYPALGDASEGIPNLTALIESVVAAQPGGIVVIGFEESGELIQAMADVGIR